MFRVLCINNRQIKKATVWNKYLPFLKEGEEYTVEFVDENGNYKILGIDKMNCHSHITGHPMFIPERFVPLTEVDAEVIEELEEATA